MNFRQELLTPELAREWLETMPDFQRKPSPMTVDVYAQDMKNGRWLANTCEAIKFDAHGHMIDGQHRCLAVIKSDVSVPVTVVDGLGDDVYKVLDRGRKRSASDAMIGSNKIERASCARSMIALNKGVTVLGALGYTSNTFRQITQQEIIEFENANSEIVKYVAIDCGFVLKKSLLSMPQCVAVVMAAYAATKTRIGGIDSFKRFCDETALPIEERPAILTMLREECYKLNSNRKSSFEQRMKLFCLIKVTYDNWLSGTIPQRLATGKVSEYINNIPVKRDWGKPEQPEQTYFF